MKHLKILGLAAIAALALMAFVGAGSASATVLCKTVPTTGGKCDSDYGPGTEIHAVLKAGTKAILEEDPGGILVECEESTLSGETTNTGSATETVDGNISVLTWGKCNHTVDNVALGLLEVHSASGGLGTVTAKGTEVTVVIFGVSCTFTATDIGTLTAPASSTSDTVLDVNATPTKTAGGFLCPSSTKWTAEYTVTSPVPLYVAES